MAPKILLVDTNYPINTRNQRIVYSLRENYGVDNVGVLAWNRSDEIEKPNINEFLYHAPARLGNRIEKLKRIKNFSAFVKQVVDTYSPNIIIASHWDSLLVCSRFARKGIHIIYENLDMPSGSKLTRVILNQLEKLALRNSSAIVHASRFFMPHYKYFKSSQIIVENLPELNPSFDIKYRISSTSSLKIVFNGGLRYADTMINLIEAIGNNDLFELDLYGGVVGREGERILEFAKLYSNVKYHGPYKYSEIENILNRADILWAVYTSTVFNVKYAISNKFHESMLYGVPAIFAKDTKLGEFVKKEGIGIVVNDQSVEDIRTTLLKIQADKYNILKRLSSKINQHNLQKPKSWKAGFNTYIDLINSLNINEL